ncbi:MAG: RNA methyltransferase [Planctomycetota bacterium]
MTFDFDPPDDAPVWLLPAVYVLDQWMGRNASPRESIATPANRRLQPDERALLMQIAYGAIRDERKLSWALGESIEELDRNARAAAIVLAEAFVVLALDLDEVRHLFERWSTVELQWDSLLDAEDAIAELEDDVQRFALQHSLPDWIAQLLLREFGDEADAIALSMAAPPPRAIRANRLRLADRSALALKLAEAGISTILGRYAPDALVVTDNSSLFDTVAYREGGFEQQDEGSQLVALVTAPPPKGRVLDACAGAGGKSLALAAMLQNAGRVLAVDVHKGRVDDVKQRAGRAGAFNLTAEVVPEDSWPESVATFAASADRILLDVPCSGLGSWRRRPEARWTLAPQDLDKLERTQRELIDRAVLALKPGARLVYATCTMLRRENEGQVEAAMQRHPQLELVRIAEILGKEKATAIADPTGTFLSLRPDRHATDGFFAAVLRKKK